LASQGESIKESNEEALIDNVSDGKEGPEPRRDDLSVSETLLNIGLGAADAKQSALRTI